MEPPHPIAAENSRLHRLLTLGARRVSLTGETLSMEGPVGGGPRHVQIWAIHEVSVRPSWFWHRLSIRLADGSERSVGGLDEEDAVRVRAAVVEAAARVAMALNPHLKQLDERFRHHFAGDRYVRFSQSRRLYDSLAPVLRKCKGLVRECLDHEAREVVGRLAPLEEVEAFEATRRRVNGRFTMKNIPTVRASALKTLRNPLTEEQAEAVATDEDVTLVLAGAGTGKTSVIVGKVAHLVRNQGVSPDEVLVLAFNRKAASEIRGRLKGDLASAHVYNFHGFGHRVIAESEKTPTVSKLAEDPLKLRRAVGGILRELLNDPGQSESVIDFIVHHQAPYKSAFDFDTLHEYEEFVKHVELRALSGDLVKSFEELEIANYLTEHRVKFRYEGPYETDTVTQQRRQYQPDFFLPDYGIYIEHFALDQIGRPPPGWRGYGEGVEWKRNIHRQRGSTLVETYSWQYRQGVLLETLRTRLEDSGVRFEQVPRHTLVQKLAQEQVSRLTDLLSTFLNHVKSGRLSPDDLRAYARGTGDRRRNESFLEVFEQVLDRYQKRLADQATVDFHDLINRAVDHIGAGRWKPQYRYVLVDEFQDISAGRMALLQVLQRQDVAFFLVGDDWQSIYRFAGSDIGLLRYCGDWLGQVEERTLGRTFRFADGILGPSSAFVKRNPEQTQRTLLPASDAEDAGITVIAHPSHAGGVARALQDIEASVRSRQSVLVLGRYGQRRVEAPRYPGRGELKTEFSTVHAAKGREEDYVIVLDLNDGRWGFPSRFEDDPLLDLVLPPSGGAYPFAEERRLFYVAMTRARKGVYLVTDPVQPSTFVTELMEKSDRIRRIGELALECPRCRRGRLSASTSPKYLTCSDSRCHHHAPRCPSCNAGFALVGGGVASCTNQRCRRPPVVCPKCGMGVLRVIDGRFGAFWGCTEFSSRESCRYRRKIGRGNNRK